MIAVERLLMLALDELDDAEATEVEAHVLACGACAARFERLLRLGALLGEIVRAGAMSFAVTPSLTAELEAAGLVSRAYRLAPEEIVPCSVGADDIYALTTLEAKLDDVARLDLTVTLPAATMRMTDVPFARERGLVAYVTPSRHLRQLPSTRVTIELLDGDRRIGRYFLDHSAFSGG